MTIAGVRFGHVAFRVADVERSVKWYGDAFGARKVFHGEPQAGRQELMFLEFAPGQHIEIFTNGTAKAQTLLLPSATSTIAWWWTISTRRLAIWRP